MYLIRLGVDDGTADGVDNRPSGDKGRASGVNESIGDIHELMAGIGGLVGDDDRSTIDVERPPVEGMVYVVGMLKYTLSLVLHLKSRICENVADAPRSSSVFRRLTHLEGWLYSALFGGGPL